MTTPEEIAAAAKLDFENFREMQRQLAKMWEETGRPNWGGPVILTGRPLPTNEHGRPEDRPLSVSTEGGARDAGDPSTRHGRTA